jgi:hypothetical protein
MSARIALPHGASIDRALAEARAYANFGLGGGCSVAPKVSAGSGGRGMGASYRTDPRCYDINYLMCCKVPIGRAQLDVEAGTPTVVQVEPDNSTYFKPCAFAIVVTDAADETLRREARWFGAYIQDCPQTGIRERNPVAASTNFIYTSTFDPVNRDGCACPVSWGTFSSREQKFPLDLVFFNSNAMAINIQVTVYGDESQCAPSCDMKGSDYGGFPKLDPRVQGDNGHPPPVA